MEFRIPYVTYENEPTPTGEEIEIHCREAIDENGNRYPIEDVKVNIWEKIQESAESCDIKNILRRAQMGDVTALNKIEGVYEDVVDAPKTLAEAQNFILQAKQDFEKLPVAVKRAFDNNVEQYIATFGSESWLEKTGIADRIRERETIKKNREEQDARIRNNLAKIGGDKNE